MGKGFHLVCHECTEEGVYGDRQRAVSARERHERDADHRVSLLDITDPRTDAAELEPSP